MKRLNLVIPGLAAISMLLTMANLSTMAQVFSDDFTSDSSLGSEWYNMTNSSTATFALNPSPGQGLALTVNAATGKTDEAFAQFSATPITLTTVGDYLTLAVNFNSPNVSANTGGLLTGLFNTQGTVATGNVLGTGTGGATADDKGYFGLMGFNTSAGTSTKFYSRLGAGTGNINELGYYSSMNASQYTQLSTFPASGNGTLANNTAYTLTYTVTKGASGNTITAIITQGATTVDSWTTTDASGAYNSFDELDFGSYGKNAAVNFNITQIQITDLIQTVPEPSTMALAGLGLLGLAARFRRVRG